MGGRVTLIKSTLANLLVYFLFVFKIPTREAKRIEKMTRDFLWEPGQEKDHLIRWEIVSRSKEEGGLGLGNITFKNVALLGKWLWRWPLERERLWHEVVASIYGCSGNGWDAGVSRWATLATPWKAIHCILPQFLRFVSFSVPYDLSMGGKNEPWAEEFLASMMTKWERCKQAWGNLQMEK
uniref:Uncharacterized protein n=1 Tax=Nelumbo nucifera TaxID=4432 RepID=A0A822Z344_NELNU|nr:TPA_asm: hypothetical protein HUJ06_006568 [Nelumbo nucifera]